MLRLKEMNAEKERLLEEKESNEDVKAQLPSTDQAKAGTEGNQLVVYDQKKAQEQQRVSPGPMIQPRKPRKGVRGPILL